jgi:Ca2+-binding EF-hand superfamily protein
MIRENNQFSGKITALDLSFNSLNNESLIALTESGCLLQSIQTLTLAKNNLGRHSGSEMHLVDLMESISANHGPLMLLDISANWPGATENSSRFEAVNAAARAVQTLQSLRITRSSIRTHSLSALLRCRLFPLAEDSISSPTHGLSVSLFRVYRSLAASALRKSVSLREQIASLFYTECVEKAGVKVDAGKVNARRFKRAMELDISVLSSAQADLIFKKMDPGMYGVLPLQKAAEAFANILLPFADRRIAEDENGQLWTVGASLHPLPVSELDLSKNEIGCSLIPLTDSAKPDLLAELFGDAENATKNLNDALSMFTEIDSSGDGFIDMSEMTVALEQLEGFSTDPDRICRAIFDRVDKDKDGRVSIEEFLDATKELFLESKANMTAKNPSGLECRCIATPLCLTIVATAAQSMPALQRLSLASNAIDAQAISCLVHHGLFRCSLQHLDLSSNCIGAEGAVALADASIFEGSLKELLIQGNGVSDSASVLRLVSALRPDCAMDIRQNLTYLSDLGRQRAVESLQHVQARLALRMGDPCDHLSRDDDGSEIVLELAIRRVVASFSRSDYELHLSEVFKIMRSCDPHVSNAEIRDVFKLIDHGRNLMVSVDGLLKVLCSLPEETDRRLGIEVEGVDAALAALSARGLSAHEQNRLKVQLRRIVNLNRAERAVDGAADEDASDNLDVSMVPVDVSDLELTPRALLGVKGLVLRAQKYIRRAFRWFVIAAMGNPNRPRFVMKLNQVGLSQTTVPPPPLLCVRVPALRL